MICHLLAKSTTPETLKTITLLSKAFTWPNDRVVLGKGVKVLIDGSAQGICPPHPGR